MPLLPLLPRGDGGIERGPLSPNTTRTSILVAMLTLAIYMAALVDLKVFATFKRRNTIYFWSLLVTSWGIMSHSLGIILKWFVGACPWYINTAFASFGWWGMVTGQSLVLYSRLHLVVRNPKILRSVLAMIIFNFCIFQVPTTILTFGSNQAKPGKFLTIYNVYERIQLIVFTLQELAISLLYIRAAFKMILPDDPTETRITKKFLIYLNVLCIVLDIAFVCEVYSGEWVYKTGTQSLAYAIKLTLEFMVLNKLMDVYRLGPGACLACRRGLQSSGQARSGNARAGSDYLHYKPNSRPSAIRHGSSGQGGGINWPRAKGRGVEPLGPFGEELEEYDNKRGHGKPVVRAEPGSPKEIDESGKDIIVTTGISTTWSEPRSTPSSAERDVIEKV
ncbi:MAG: hypothetical protein LQ352_006218 [Teloschistes flavicans]|nr:MAG: hypothetical protein LQ352_006218 [Teloschistes flavicans]